LIIEKEVILKAKEKLGEDNFTNIMSALGVDEFDEKK
jgi:hypothetical protein